MSSDTLGEAPADPNGTPLQRFLHELGPPNGVVQPDDSEEWAAGYNAAHERAVDASKTVLSQLEAERDEARADRDRLHDALEPLVNRDRHDTLQKRCREGNCPTCREAKQALREVERGDTVDKIRREAFEEAIEYVVNETGEEGRSWQMVVADGIRALAEEDDTEEE